MAKALTTKINVQLDAILTNLVGVANVQATASRGLITALASGVGAQQADLIFSETNTIALSATKDYDLSGVLTDVFGSVLAFARLKAILCFADPGNTNDIKIGAAAATQFLGPLGSATDTIAVKPGGVLCLIAPGATGWPVVGAASDLLRFTNGGAGTGVSYDVIFVGASA